MFGFALRWWTPYVATVATTMAILSLSAARDEVWNHPGAAFGFTLAMTAACAVGAAVVLGMALMRRLPEVALLGSALWVVSVLPLIHGLLLPGHLYSDNPGSSVALMAAVPAGLVAALPMLLDGTRAGSWLAHRWRAWAFASAAVPTAAVAMLLVWPELVPVPGGAWPKLIVAVSVGGTAFLSLRHLRLFAIGRRGGSLIASLGFMGPGLATIAFLGATPMSYGWWMAHVIDGFGVLFAAGGLLLAHWRDRSLSFVLSPILTREPLAALELGLTPVVHGFIAELERKDTVTREHVVRVGELAMRTGVRAGLNPLELRALGLGGLLHDVGKLLVPEEILGKPGKLTDDERTVIERHPADGARLLSAYPHLAEVATVVVSHHERPDGGGYPGGLTERQIPLTAAIVSVVDAWDAMVSDRPYRDGMPRERAEAILRDGAGTQWSHAAVHALLAEVRVGGPVTVPRLAAVGRQPAADAADDLVDDCLPAMPGLAAVS